MLNIYSIYTKEYRLKIILLNTSDQPIYEQIKEQIKSAILSGELKEAEALPSIRQLARDLKISVITTTRAYNELEKEGLITSRQGKGCFVMPKNEAWVKEQALKDVENHMSGIIKAAKLARIPQSELKEIIAFYLEQEQNHD